MVIMTQNNLTILDNQGIPDGYKKAEICSIPKDWLIQKFKDCCIKIQDGNYGAFYPKSNEFLSYGIPFLTSKVLGKSGRISYDKIDYISQEKHSELKKAQLKLNDVLLTNRGGSVGAVAMVNEIIQHGNIGPQLTLLRVNECVKSNYLYQYMKSNLFQNQISEIDSGSAMNFFGIKATENFLIPLPPNLDEQQSIATALSDTDTLISELEKLIEKKQAIKTATMQQLLTGKIRLPEFALREDGTPKGYKDSELGQIPEDWEAIRIGSTLTIKHGKSQKLVESNDGKFPILATGGQIGWAKEYLYNKPSVLIGRKGTINKPRFIDQPFWSVDTLFYSEINEKYCAKFLFYKFCRIDWNNYNEASGVPSLNAKTIENVLISIGSLDEQKQIVKCLHELDTEIIQMVDKLRKLIDIKKGMMQELLTGKTRLV